MRTLPFTKMEGAGNDFLLIDNRKGLLDKIELADLVRRICDRRFGVGADGVILLQQDERTVFFMRYFNSGGDEASMCGNGARCLVRFAERLGLFRDRCRFRTASGSHDAEVAGELVRLRVGHAEITETNKTVTLPEGQFHGDLVDVGIPHFVVAAVGLAELPFKDLARKIRYAPELGEGGANVNFVEISRDGVQIRTYERGVENETLACGTGAIAAALAGAQRDTLKSPVTVSARGGRLRVSFRANPRPDGRLAFDDIWLEGPARFISDGLYYYPD